MAGVTGKKAHKVSPPTTFAPDKGGVAPGGGNPAWSFTKGVAVKPSTPGIKRKAK